jgi:insecticidal toxin complex protein TccC
MSFSSCISRLQSLTKPNDFKELTPNIAGMSLFSDNTDLFSSLLWLYKSGYKTMISIEPDNVQKTLSVTNEMMFDFQWYGSFLDDWHAPSVEHLLEYCKLVQQRKKFGSVVTHCWGGTGRTACFLAAYWLYSNPNLTAEHAFTFLRKNYSIHSIEMKAQYNTLARFSDYLLRAPSLDVESRRLNHGGGSFNRQHKNDGMLLEPGHKGGSTYHPININNVMTSADGIALSTGPYVSQNPNLKPQSTLTGISINYPECYKKHKKSKSLFSCFKGVAD